MQANLKYDCIYTENTMPLCNATVNYFETGTNVQSAKFMSITAVSCHAITIHSQLWIFARQHYWIAINGTWSHFWKHGTKLQNFGTRNLWKSFISCSVSVSVSCILFQYNHHYKPFNFRSNKTICITDILLWHTFERLFRKKKEKKKYTHRKRIFSKL